MLTMTSLGAMGRLGNQMFQYAALRGIAAHRGLSFRIPEPRDPPGAQCHQLFDAFFLEGAQTHTPKRFPRLRIRHRRSESSFRFDKDLFDTCPDGSDLYGYFQSEKYFQHIKDELIADFRFRCEAETNVPNGDYIAIHVRRGDYLHLSHAHPLCTPEFYERALDCLPKNVGAIVFSDDLEWCRHQDVFSGCDFSEGLRNDQDLFVMTRASHNIIANSSFSWWGAWLNTRAGRTVIAPSQWFNPVYKPTNEVQDLLPSDWLVI